MSLEAELQNEFVNLLTPDFITITDGIHVAPKETAAATIPPPIKIDQNAPSPTGSDTPLSDATTVGTPPPSAPAKTNTNAQPIADDKNLPEEDGFIIDFSAESPKQVPIVENFFAAPVFKDLKTKLSQEKTLKNKAYALIKFMNGFTNQFKGQDREICDNLVKCAEIILEVRQYESPPVVDVKVELKKEIDYQGWCDKINAFAQKVQAYNDQNKAEQVALRQAMVKSTAQVSDLEKTKQSLSDTNNQLEKNKKALEEKQTQLKKTLATYIDKLTQVTTQISHLQKDLTAAENDKASLAKQLGLSTTQIKKLETDQKQSAQEIDKINKEFTSQKQLKEKELQCLIQSLNKSCQDKVDLEAKLSGTIQKLAADLKAEKTKSADVQITLKIAEAYNDSYQMDLNESKAIQEKLRAEIDRIKKEITTVRGDAQTRYEETCRHNTTLKARIDPLEAQLHDAKSKLTATSTKNAEQSYTIDQQIIQIQKLKKDLKDLEALKKELTAKKEEVRIAVNSYQEQIQIIKSLESNKKGLEEVNSTLGNKCKRLEDQNNKQRVALGELTEKNKALEGELKALKSSKAAADAELQALKTSKATVDAELKALKASQATEDETMLSPEKDKKFIGLAALAASIGLHSSNNKSKQSSGPGPAGSTRSKLRAQF